MRNAVKIGDHFILTTDNSGGIGEKTNDLVAVSDVITAKYAARVALLEQWAANADPEVIFIHNFSGNESWEKYVEGVKRLFEEASLPLPPISGSTETNMSLQQSAIAVTMIGKQASLQLDWTNCSWFVYGKPLVGTEVVDEEHSIASLAKLNKARNASLIHRIWPVGSKGVQAELQHLFNDAALHVTSNIDCHKSSGPSTAVLLAVKDVEKARDFFGELLFDIRIK